MKSIAIFLFACFIVGAANATIITVDHNVTTLPPGGYLETDLDADGIVDINLASNFYVSVWGGNTQFTTPYSLIGEVIGDSNSWMQGNTWLDLSGPVQNYVQDGLLYLGVRNTSLGSYYGYITYNYDSYSNSISLNSYTYDKSGQPLVVSTTTVPEPSSVWLLGAGLAGLIGIARRKVA